VSALGLVLVVALVFEHFLPLAFVLAVALVLLRVQELRLVSVLLVACVVLAHGLSSPGRCYAASTGLYVSVVAEQHVLDVAGRSIAVTSPDKVFFSERGETKLDLVRYYLAVADPLMRAVRGRPTLMQRFPHGAEGSSFFQKRVPGSAPEWLETTIVSTPNGTTARALVLADMAHVVWAVNLACLGFHVWPFEADRPDVADELRLDLDPQPGVEFDEVRAAAVALRGLLDELGITGHPKTTGNRGLHVYVRLEPRWDSYEVRAAAVAAARELERRRPELITAAWWKEERGRRVFLDYNQNAPHKTVFGAWSVRARPGAQVSTPLRWDDVATIHPDELTIAAVPERVAAGGDPWQEIDREPQSLEPLLALHERDRAAGLMDAPWPPVYPKQPDEPPRVAPSRARSDKHGLD
jgi:DNA ligase D